MDPAAYAELWLADAGLVGSPDYLDRYDGVAGLLRPARRSPSVGMGWIVLRRAGRDDPRVRIEDWPYELEQPIGPAFAAEQRAIDVEIRLSDADVLGARWQLASDVVAETSGQPGAADPEHLIFRQHRGFRRAVELDTGLGAVLGACDGELALDRLITAVAELLDVDPVQLAAEVVPRVRALSVDGIVHPAIGPVGVHSDQP